MRQLTTKLEKCKMPEEKPENLLADAFAEKTQTLTDRKEKVTFNLGLWEARLRKLGEIQTKKRFDAIEEFAMVKEDMSDTAKEINKLQEDIKNILEKKSASEEELRNLETRLKSLEAMLPSSDTSKN